MSKLAYIGAGRYGTQIHYVTDMSGMTFSRLTVLRYVEGSSPPKWVCRCTCRRRVEVAGANLKNGHTQSCGCLQTVGKTTHGKAYDPLYSVWRNMWARCTDPANKRWGRYGGRGIAVCDRWKDINLWAQDMGPRPEGYQIERNDTNGDYEPSNCTWADRNQQANNRSNNVNIEYKGKTQSIAAWARDTGIKASTLRKRYVDLGWSVPRSLGESE